MHRVSAHDAPVDAVAATRAFLVALVCVACSGEATAPGAATNGDTTTTPGMVAPESPSGPFVVGNTYVDPGGWIEYQPGDAPLILIAPHGGLLSPSSLPDRSCPACETANDLNTQELARVIVDSFTARTGKRPHLVVNRLHRRKFDANRELGEATNGWAALERPWRWLHGFVDTAKATVVRTSGQGLVLDLHGHAHAVARLELGYLLGAATLRADDVSLAAANATNQSSIARMARDARAGEPPVAVLNGPNSLGTLLATAGIPAVPSVQDRAPAAGQDYFSGGYNTDRHGSRVAGTIDAIQIGHNNAGIRDTPANRERYAGILVSALATYFSRHYGWR